MRLVSGLAQNAWRMEIDASEAVVLTVRVEDAWLALPSRARVYLYKAQIVQSGVPGERLLRNVAPDARIMLEFAAGSSAFITFMPEDALP